MKELTLPIEFEEPSQNRHFQMPKPEFIAQQPKLTPIPLDEVRKSAIEYFDGDTLSAEVWINKYALKDYHGNIYEKSPDDMHRRMSGEISRIEKKYPNPLTEEQIYQTFKNFKYIVPQGGSMAGIGNNFQIVSLSNCFVIGNPSGSDSYGAIMKIDEEQVQLMKRRGGVGHDLSSIRPKKSPVKNSALSSTGVVSFMERYSNSTREVAQDGRRGALMLSLSMNHPDVKDFITAKTDTSKITGANISVRIDDAFMKAVIQNDDFELQFPVDSPNPIYTNKVKAKELWDLLIESSWNSAEPGILFWDTVIRESIPDSYAEYGFGTVSTNPCGEIPLCPYDSCRLLAINLYSHVKNPFTSQAEFDFSLFRENVRIAQRIMDDIIDLELEKIDQILHKIANDPEPSSLKRTEKNLWEKIRNKCIEGRRTGIGITGEGDMLAALGYRYASPEGIEFSVNVHKELAINAYKNSVEAAKERGAFPLYNSTLEENNPFIKRLKEEDAELYKNMITHGRRNIALLTIAPTGTVSMMTRTTSGIEPAFRISYSRRRKLNPNEAIEPDFTDQSGDKWVETRVFHHVFKDYLLANDINLEDIQSLTEEKLNALIENSPYNLSTAADIDWVQKVKMQGEVQKWIDHSISVTVNLPEETSKETISEIFQSAWQSGCKGVTIYREGSRTGVLVADTKKQDDISVIKETKPPRRPNIIEARILRFMNNHEKWIAVVGLVNDRPYEIFTGKTEDSFLILSSVDKGWVIKRKSDNGKTIYDFQYEDKEGYKITIEGLSRCFDKEYWNYAKLISGVMRHGMPLKFVVSMVEKLNLNDESLNTWKNGVVRTLSKFIEDGTEPVDNLCPECHTNNLNYQEGCLTCSNCGHTRCG